MSDRAAPSRPLGPPEEAFWDRYNCAVRVPPVHRALGPAPRRGGRAHRVRRLPADGPRGGPRRRPDQDDRRGWRPGGKRRRQARRPRRARAARGGQRQPAQGDDGRPARPEGAAGGDGGHPREAADRGSDRRPADRGGQRPGVRHGEGGAAGQAPRPRREEAAGRAGGQRRVRPAGRRQRRQGGRLQPGAVAPLGAAVPHGQRPGLPGPAAGDGGRHPGAAAAQRGRVRAVRGPQRPVPAPDGDGRGHQAAGRPAPLRRLPPRVGAAGGPDARPGVHAAVVLRVLPEGAGGGAVAEGDGLPQPPRRGHRRDDVPGDGPRRRLRRGGVRPDGAARVGPSSPPGCGGHALPP